MMLNQDSSYVKFVQEKLASKRWRLNNLYYITDKKGKKTLLKMNPPQEMVSKILHPRKIILKSRQVGISTYYLAHNLDSAIFKENFQAGIQSYGEDEAMKLASRAQFMWDNLEPEIKQILGINLDKNNTKHKIFTNGSSLRLGNFRGDTLQSLHVSELGKIAAKFPAKAEELKNGAFQAVGQGQIITIESTAEGASGLFYDMYTTAERKLRRGDALSPLDFYAIFIGWWSDPDCTLSETYAGSFEEELRDLRDYFEKIENVAGIKLSLAQKTFYAQKYSDMGYSVFQEYPGTAEEAFKASTEGSYYKNEMKWIRHNNRILPNMYVPTEPVYVAMDLGASDLFTMVFAQVINGRVRWIGGYKNNYQSIAYYCQVLRQLQKEKGYRYAQFFGPHDTKVFELGTGRTRIEVFRDNGVNITRLKKTSISDGIDAVRTVLRHSYIDESAEDIVITLDNYTKKWDRSLNMYIDEPVHDEHSHMADAIRYMSIGLNKYIVEKSQEDYVEPERIMPEDTQIDNVYDGLAL